MQKQFLNFRKVFTNIAFSTLILISNNSELAAKYLPNEVDQSIKTIVKPNINNVFFQGIDIQKEKKFLFAEKNNDTIVSLDKDRFRNDLGGLIEAYSEINRRINDFLQLN